MPRGIRSRPTGMNIPACGVPGGRHLTHAVGRELYDLARAEVAHEAVTQIVETRTLAGADISFVVLAYGDGGAAEAVAGGIYGAVGEYEHRARTLDLALYQFDTLLERLALTDEYGYQLGRVDRRVGEFGEVVALSEQFVRELLDVVDACDRNHGVAAQRRGDDYGVGPRCRR